MFLANVFNGLLVDFDAVPIVHTEKILELFEGIGDIEMYFVPKRTADRKMVYSSMARFGAYILMQFKKLYTNTLFQHSEHLYGVERDEKISADFERLQGYYARYRVLTNKFIDVSSLRLSPYEKKILFTSLMFDFSLEQGYPSEFVGKNLEIKTNDVYWISPSTLFDNYQGQASDNQEIKLKLAKWIGSPIMYDPYDSSYLETNITEVAVLNTAGIKINITNLSDPIVTRAPWTQKGPYDVSLIKCKQWDLLTSNFTDANCDDFTSKSAVLSCST